MSSRHSFRLSLVNPVILVLAALFMLQCGSSSAAQWSEVVAPGVRVLYQDPELEHYAQQVAGRAVHALAGLEELFRTDSPRVTIELDARTDLYAAIAPPLPRPRVSLPALFPALAEVDLRTRDPLMELLLHELTHTVQLSYLERPPGVPPLPRLGLVGEAVAPLPPGWLLEGLAVWTAEHLSSELGGAESGRTESGRTEAGGAGYGGEAGGTEYGDVTPGPERHGPDARTLGVLHSLALEGEWPSLEDVSLLSHRPWPGGEARYLLGGAFVGELVEEYGWESLLAALRQANSGWYPMPFAEAWRLATGGDLREAWQRWERELRAQATARAVSAKPDGTVALTASGEGSIVLALSPSGEQLAWRPSSGGLLVSRLTAHGLAETERVLAPSVYPRAVDWLNEGRLVYTRLTAGTDHRFSDLFELELASGRERRLTRNERARLPRAGPGGCTWYVRDVVSEASELRRLCDEGEPERVFVAPHGMHIVGLALGERGQVALSVWRNGFVDLALLERGRLRWLTQDAAQDLDPVWSGDDLLFRSDRGPVFQVYSLLPGERELGKLTDSLGGAFGPSAAGGRLVFARLSGRGYQLAAGSTVLPVERVLLDSRPVPSAPNYGGPYPVRAYRPGVSLLPYGWLPEASLASVSPLAPSASVAILGQDRSGDHSYALRVGYDPRLGGPLPGAWASLGYDYRAVDVLDLFQRPPPLSFGVRVGAWPWDAGSGSGSGNGSSNGSSSGSERALAALAELRLRGPIWGWSSAARIRAGLVHLPSHGGVQPDARLEVAVSRRVADLWGYGVRGPRLSLHANWSADAAGGSPAVWLDASTVFAVDAGIWVTTELALRAGFRPQPPIPLDLPGFALLASAAARDTLELGWRYRDGVAAVERLSVEGRIHGFYDGSAGAAVDVSLWADTILRYGAPVSLGGTAGYARGWWYRIGARLPL